MISESNKKLVSESNKKGKGFAVAAALLFIFAVWFAALGAYLYRAMINFKPLPGEVQEGDMVSVLLMQLMFLCAALCSAVSLIILLIYFFKRRRIENDFTV